MENRPAPEKRPITASDLANYVVCPEAWRLKYFGVGRKKMTSRSAEGQKLREEWVQKQDLSARLRLYTKIVYALVVIFVFVVFLLDRQLSLRLKFGLGQKPAKTEKILEEHP